MANPTLYPNDKSKYAPKAKKAAQAILRANKQSTLANRISENTWIYGPKAVAGIKWIQKANGLKVDGIVGYRTWAVLERGANPAPKPKVRKPAVAYDGRKAGKTHGSQTPRVIVLHDTESHDQKGIGDIKGVLGYLSRTADGLNAHLCIDAEGYTGQGADFNRKCYHAAGGNTNSIGIEMIGFASFSVKKWYGRPGQLEAVAKWLAYLSVTYDIPLVHSTSNGVCRHKDIPQGAHHDPGVSFPYKRVLKMANEYKEKGW